MDSKILKLIDRLNETVDFQDVNWKETSKKDQYSLNLNGGQILIEKNINQIPYSSDYFTSYKLSILNLAGKEIEKVWISEIENEDKEYYDKLNQLYNKVDRKVRGIDGVLDSMLSDLDSKLSF